MQIRVDHIIESETWTGDNGSFVAWYFVGTDEAGNQGTYTINTTPKNQLTAGTTFDFEGNGRTKERGGYSYSCGKRANKPGYGGGNRGGGGGSAPAAAPRPSARPEADVLADFQRINAALGVAASDGQATTVVLGILRGDIIPTPQAPAAPRLPLPAQKPALPGYNPAAPQPQDDGDIPF